MGKGNQYIPGGGKSRGDTCAATTLPALRGDCGGMGVASACATLPCFYTGGRKSVNRAVTPSSK